MIFYDIFIWLFVSGLNVFSWFNEKARKGILGRREGFAKIHPLKGKKVIWMHAASLGEYEQGLPVLEKLKEKYPNYKILITFFSPSGYENVMKKQHLTDVICYLPFDKKSEIQRFISTFETEIFFTVKYDFWYHLLRELHQKGTKIFVVSALFYEKQIFFKTFGKWLVKQLKENVDWFFHQNEYSEKLAKSIGLENSSTSGDTRFDRVKQIRERDNFVEFIQEFRGNKKLVIFGSSWESEEKIAEILAQKSDAKIIIAPHETQRELRITRQKSILKYSEIKSQALNLKSQILIIDCIGLLSEIYSYADVAVVGGGFHKKGLHNILEAATFGVPVIFGSHYRKNPEADQLIKSGGGKSFGDEMQAAEFILNLLNNPHQREKMAKNSSKFINSQPDATEIILKKIQNIVGL